MSYPVTETCKHCGGPIHRNPYAEMTTLDWTHSDGPQAGRFTCPVDPYGFHAEPVDTECGSHPANPCNGARGIGVRQESPYLPLHREANEAIRDICDENGRFRP